MCGIIGYTGAKQAQEIMLDALEVLEYRGYDSAGIAVCGSGAEVQIRKCAGRVKDLRSLCEGAQVNGTCGIGHTRWATHGGVNDENAHPHKFGKVTVIHNGIIENYKSLISKYELQEQLKSETDSEVAQQCGTFFIQDPYAAIRKTVLKLKGTFGWELCLRIFRM